MKRSRAARKAVESLPTNTVTRAALSRQAKEAAARRSPAERSRAAKKAARSRRR